jgi:voltage-gated potassium channel
MRSKKGIFWRLVHSSIRVKIVLYFLLFVFQIVAYTSIFYHAYPILEGKPITWPTSLLFVLETVTTTGYGELLPFTNQITVVMTIIMMITGIILIFMIIPLLLVPYLRSLFQTTPPRRVLHSLQGHVVIVGFGELVKSLVESLLISDLPILIVVDDQETARIAATKFGNRAYVIWGDYSDPVTWNNSWAKNAKYVIVTEDERTTSSVILGIREICKGKIIAVVDNLAFDRYLRYAGAEYVLSPKHVTGKILARHATLTSHIDTIVEETIFDHITHEMVPSPSEKLRIINIPILPGSRAAGRRLGDLELFERYEIDTLLLSKGGHFIFYPSMEVEIDTTTMLFLIGKVGRIQEVVEAEFLSAGEESELAIIAGFGDVGASTYRELTDIGIDCVVIDRKKHPVSEVIGNAEDESILRDAHIEEAKFCIVALNDDDVNIFTTLMARNLNPSLRILTRANEAVSVDKLYRAGADYVALLPTIGGQVIGGVILSDIVDVILDLPNDQKVVRMRVLKNTSKTVEWIEKKAGVKVLGIEGISRSVIRPDGGETLMEGDSLIAMGTVKDLKRLIRRV